RLDVRRMSAIKDNDRVVGNRTRIKVVKNKLAPPFREVEVDILYGRGIWVAGDLLDCAVAANVVSKSGTWFSWEKRQLGQGRDRAAQALTDDVSLAASLRDTVLARLS